MKRTLILSLSLLTLAACMTASSGGSAPQATVSLASSAGDVRGSARIADGANGLQVSVAAKGLPAGTHGVHLHTTGRCDAPDFASAGGHWNPTARKHGRNNPDGAHHGDLPNIEIGPDGRGRLSFTVPSATLSQLMDQDGAALVVHATADDYRTDPSGNSGSRIACGIVKPS
jgi:Cu-Zn family superoxide dismutase